MFNRITVKIVNNLKTIIVLNNIIPNLPLDVERSRAHRCRRYLEPGWPIGTVCVVDEDDVHRKMCLSKYIDRI